MQSDLSKQPTAGAPRSIKRPCTKTKFMLEELQRYAYNYCGAELQKLPPPASLVFANQTMDPNGSKHRLALGHIQMSHILLPLWVHLTDSCQVEFRYGADIPVPQERFDRFRLTAPFCSALDHVALETLIVFYFVTAGKWPHFPNGERNQISLSALQRACKQVASGTPATGLQQHMAKDMKCEQFPVKSEVDMVTPHEPPNASKRKHDDLQRNERAKRRATATTKKRLLAAEVDAKEAQLAEMTNTVHKVLDMAELHATWASDVLGSKNIPEGARDAAKIQLDADVEELRTFTDEFRTRHVRRMEK